MSSSLPVNVSGGCLMGWCVRYHERGSICGVGRGLLLISASLWSFRGRPGGKEAVALVHAFGSPQVAPSGRIVWGIWESGSFS